EVVVYTVTPTSTDGCEGETFTVTITVNPEPVGSPGTATVCSNELLEYNLTNLITNGVNSTFTWTFTDNPNVNGETVGSGSVMFQTLTNFTSIAQTVVYTVTPTSDPDGCIGATFTVTVTVNPEPVGSDPTPTTCS